MVTVRPETALDHAGVRLVHERAFGRSTEADAVDAVRAHGQATISLVAVDGERVVGHVLFSPVTLEAAPEISGLGLAPLAVLPEFQNRGVGAALARAGLEACRSLGCAFVVVLGDPRYYGRFGFRPAHTFGLRCQWEVPADAFQALELQPDALAGRGGLARYLPEWDGV